MKKIASIHAYDVLDQIAINVLVREYPDYDEGPSEIVLQQVQYTSSEGLASPTEWVQDVLLALLETL